MILHDDIAHHRKFLLAGERIGEPGGAARALALYVAAIGYARDQLTNGFIDDAFVTKFLLDSDANLTAKALSARNVKLFHRVRGGYQIHDFVEHNGSAAKLRHQRQLARERKRRQRAREVVENPVENFTGSARPVTRSRTKKRDILASTDTDTEKEYVRTADPDVSGTGISLSTANVVQNSGGAATHTAPTTKTTTRQARAPAADGNYAVIEKLAHEVLDNLHTTNPEAFEVVETLKQRCAQLQINYATSPNVVRRALASAATQRTFVPVGTLAGDLRGTTPAALKTKVQTLVEQSRRRR